MVYFGIDVSTQKLSIACISGDTLDFNIKELKASNKDWMRRFHVLQDKLQEYILSHEKGFYAIEDVPYVINKQSYYKLTFVIAMCCSLLHMNHMEYKVIHTNTWKKIAEIKTVKKNRKEVKLLITQKAEEIFGAKVLGYSQDAIDALLIAYAGRKLRQEGKAL